MKYDKYFLIPIQVMFSADLKKFADKKTSKASVSVKKVSYNFLSCSFLYFQDWNLIEYF